MQLFLQDILVQLVSAHRVPISGSACRPGLAAGVPVQLSGFSLSRMRELMILLPPFPCGDVRSVGGHAGFSSVGVLPERPRAMGKSCLSTPGRDFRRAACPCAVGAFDECLDLALPRVTGYCGAVNFWSFSALRLSFKASEPA